VGTPLYCAPEMLENNMSGFFSDLWALGVIIYEMSTGQKMFRGKNNRDIFDKILKHDFKFPGHLDRDTIDIINKLVQIDPFKRLGVKNINMVKDHPFFNAVDWQAISLKTFKVQDDVQINFATEETPLQSEENDKEENK